MDEDKQTRVDNDETEVVLLGTRQQMEKLKENDIFEIKIGNGKVKPFPLTRNIDFYMESQLKSQTHIAKVCSTS